MTEETVLARVRKWLRSPGKLQLTIPKAIATQYGIRAGDRLELVPTGDDIRLVPQRRRKRLLSAAERLEIFEQMMKRVDEYAAKHPPELAKPGAARDWTREDLYDGRGLPRGH